MESMGVFDHKDVKWNPEGVGILLKKCPHPGMRWVSRGWVGVKKDSKDSLLNNKGLLSRHFL